MKTEMDSLTFIRKLCFFVLNNLITVLVIYFLYTAYTYTKALDTCNCVSALKPTIAQIRKLEGYFIIIQVAGLVLNVLMQVVFYVMTPAFFVELLLENTWLVYAVGLVLCVYAVFLLTIMITFITNVIEFGKAMPPSCKCAFTWQRDILYVQAGLYGLSATVLVLGFFSASFPVRAMVAALGVSSGSFFKALSRKKKQK